MMRVCFTLLIMAFAASAFAQQPVISPDTTFKSDQPVVVVFENEETKQEKMNPYPNLAKLSIFGFLNADAALFYERKLGKKTSLEAGAGITFADYAAAIDVDDPFYSDTIIRSFRPGFSFSGGFRYYFQGAINKFYLAPEIGIRRYNSEAFVLDEAYRYKEHVNIYESKIVIGYIHVIHRHFIMEYSFGTGIRLNSYERLKYGTYRDPAFPGTKKKGIFEKDKIVSGKVYFGWKLGIPF